MRRLFGSLTLALLVLGSAALPARASAAALPVGASPVDTNYVDPCDYPDVYGPCTPRRPFGPLILY